VQGNLQTGVVAWLADARRPCASVNDLDLKLVRTRGIDCLIKHRHAMARSGVDAM